MIKRILVYTLLTESGKQYLKTKLLSADVQVFFKDEFTEKEILDIISSIHIVFGNPPVDLINLANRTLQWIQLESVGFDAYQELYINIPITNLHGYFAQPCAETVVAGILALYRKINELALLKERKRWVGSTLRPLMQLLHSKKVLFLGSGTIAMAVSDILKAFQCKMIFYGHHHSGVTLHDKQAMITVLRDVDILINTLPGTIETASFVNQQVLHALKKEAIFVNIGRGITVDEVELIRVLQQQRIGGAVLDVYAEEPLPADHPFWSCPHTILTQHTGGGSAEEEKGKIDFFADNLFRFLEGNSLNNVIKLQKGY